MRDLSGRRLAAEILERDPAAAWLDLEDEGARAVLACPVCGLLIGVGGWKGWLLRRLRLHYAKCRPRYRVYSRKHAERMERRVTEVRR